MLEAKNEVVVAFFICKFVILSDETLDPLSSLSVLRFEKLVLITDREAERVSDPAIVVMVDPKRVGTWSRK